MLRCLKNIILVLLLFYSISVYAKTPNLNCGTMSEVMRRNMEDGYAYVARGIENNGMVIVFFLNMKNGDWRVMGTTDKDHACNMLAGIDWAGTKVVSM